VVFEFSVAADGDDGVFFKVGFGISTDPSVNGDLLVFEEIFCIGAGQVIYLREDGIESRRGDRDVLFFQLRKAVLRNLFHDLAADSGVLDTIEISAENIGEFLKNETVRGIILYQDVAYHVAFDPEV